MSKFDFSKSDQSLERQLYCLLEQGVCLNSAFDPRDFRPQEQRRLARLARAAYRRFDSRPTRAGVRSYAPENYDLVG